MKMCIRDRELFGSIVQFSGYAFNKAHSVSYALIAWRAAYLKAHYPEVFYAVLLREAAAKTQGALLLEAKSLGVEILPPSVLHSQPKTALEGRAIRLGPVSYTHLDVYKRQGYRCGAWLKKRS